MRRESGHESLGNLLQLPVPQPEPSASGAGCLPLIVAALVALVLLGVIRF
ncbi:MAG: hypothetical protein WCI67_07500 [Chloroflexales bacterium]